MESQLRGDKELVSVRALPPFRQNSEQQALRLRSGQAFDFAALSSGGWGTHFPCQAMIVQLVSTNARPQAQLPVGTAIAVLPAAGVAGASGFGWPDGSVGVSGTASGIRSGVIAAALMGRTGRVSVCTVPGSSRSFHIQRAAGGMRHDKLGPRKVRRHIGGIVERRRRGNRSRQKEIAPRERAGLRERMRAAKFLEAWHSDQRSERQPIPGNPVGETARASTGPKAEGPKRARGSTTPRAVFASSSIRLPSASERAV